MRTDPTSHLVRRSRAQRSANCFFAGNGRGYCEEEREIPRILGPRQGKTRARSQKGDSELPNRILLLSSHNNAHELTTGYLSNAASVGFQHRRNEHYPDLCSYCLGKRV
jgi:hypothetical protein